MSLFPELDIPTSNLLTESYRPRRVADFIGLDKPKRLATKLVAKPYDSAWVFVGASGMGKTTLALAIAEELEAELHHIPSQRCTVDAIESVRRRCQYVPMLGKRLHLVLVDEADQMSIGAQMSLLSMLDSTNRAPNTIFIFTCNETLKLQDRFLSRCGVVEFSSYGVAKEAADMLARVWGNEVAADVPAPNFQRIVKESNNNIRAALMQLQQEIMMA
jgi:replication-associated recombination protein RarA